MGRRSRVFAILAELPERRIAVDAEAGDLAHVTVVIHSVACGELEISRDKYDAFALMALMETHGQA